MRPRRGRKFEITELILELRFIYEIALPSSPTSAPSCTTPTAAPYTGADATWPPHASHPRPIHPHAHWVTKTTPPWLCAHATRAPGISPCATPPTATHGDATSPSSRPGPNRPPHGLFCFASKTPGPINRSPRPSRANPPPFPVRPRHSRRRARTCRGAAYPPKHCPNGPRQSLNLAPLKLQSPTTLPLRCRSTAVGKNHRRRPCSSAASPNLAISRRAKTLQR